jgi:nicotinate phosphoribosyltransferase
MNINYTMLTDFYEITMANGFFNEGLADKTVYFDMFFRSVPDDGGFAVMAGVEQMIEYLSSLHFEKEDIEYLRSQNMFSPQFLDYLADFKFECDVWAAAEGTPIFPGEPIVTVKGPSIQAQFIETMLLLTVNFQTLIATKSNRISRAACGRAVMEFGARRAQGAYAALYGARAAYIGGCCGTSNVLTGQKYSVTPLGTMAHSWVQMFDSELEAFKTYARNYPDSTTLLIDTYNVLKSGLPNAIKTFDEVLKPLGKRPKGVRIDSGDITYLSKICRRELDKAGYSDCKIVASNSLDEYIIRDMLLQGAQIDTFGVGERLITSKSSPVMGGVYKLAAVEDEDGKIIPKIKISENVAKITTPCFKQVYRLYDNSTNKAIADVITLHDETIDSSVPYEIFDPEHTWKHKTIENFHVRPLLERIFDKGRCVYSSPSTDDIKSYCANQIDGLWDEIKRFENPHKYYVDLSRQLWEIKNELITKNTLNI